MSISPSPTACTCVELLRYSLTPFAIMSRSHCAVRSSPSIWRMAVTNAWKEPLVGAQPTRPVHSGPVRSKMEPGRSSGLTRSVE